MATGITLLAFPCGEGSYEDGVQRRPHRGGSAEVGAVRLCHSDIRQLVSHGPGASSVFTGFVAEII